ncbi:zinc finger protein [Fusarium circinatum]|uniref:Zinc finger protein n=1 Tax=Fusarium circinatum TaxID=48490 RepID=A0A8H5TLN1_FUSCI|nr:zinc finger protein [Fusarium circinatum]
MASTQSPATRASFRVAIVCALPREADAVTLLFDEFWDDTDDDQRDADPNTYITGRIGRHNVVLAILPGMGTTSAAAATANLTASYSSLRLALLVGICGGIPRVGNKNAFLGDVVMSRSIVQYDYGRQHPGHFVIKSRIEDSLGRPNTEIRSMLAVFDTEHMAKKLKDDAGGYLQDLQKAAQEQQRQAMYHYPGESEDSLYPPEYLHRHREWCSTCADNLSVMCEAASTSSCVDVGCNPSELVARSRTVNGSGSASFAPEIFIGRIGSGNTVMKSGLDRDRIAADCGAIAFEMEGAGAWDQVPCIVVKGICDYSDSHKNKVWQDFAAATAASVAKAILRRYAVGSNDQPSTRLSGLFCYSLMVQS